MESPDSSTFQDGGGYPLSMGDPTVTSQSGAGGEMGLTRKDKLCLVCGDKALGYNFNAVSCESCKAFFRRNAHKTIRGRCEGKCDVNVESRSFCKRCRLAKCFTAGMRKDMILNDEQKKVRKQKILFNKLRRQGHLPPEDAYSATQLDLAPMTTIPGSNSPNFKQEQHMSPSGQSCQSSSDNPGSLYPSWAESQDLMNNAVEQMPEDQQKLVAELQFAMEESCFLANTSTTLRSLPTNPAEFINLAEGMVRKVIKVAKNITIFKTLQKDDQISLLKGSVVDIMMLRSTVNYNPRTESWNLSTKDCLSKSSTATAMSPTSSISSTSGAESPAAFSMASQPASFMGSPHGSSLGSPPPHPGMSPRFAQYTNQGSAMGFTSPMGGAGAGGDEGSSVVSAQCLKMANPETLKVFMNYSKFVKSLMSSIHGDLLALKILIMMCLFSADRSELVDRENVQRVQETYASLLQAYTGLRFSEDKTLFARLVMKLTDLRNINEVHSKMLLKMKVTDIEPLLLEIFDL